MGKLLTIVLIISLFVFSAFRVCAIPETQTVTASSIEMDAQDKIAFARNADNSYAVALANGDVRYASQETLDSLIEAYTFASEENRASLESSLNQYGIFVYSTPVSDPSRSSSGDVKIYSPVVTYNSNTQVWIVSCSGKWLNDNWNTVTLGGNIGDKDAFGVGYTETGSYHSSVLSAYGYITDQTGTRTVSTSNRSDGQGSTGFGFQLQDAVSVKQGVPYYTGYKWYASCTYDSDFAYFSGIATGYYIHTYNTAHISIITFGVEGKKASIQVSIQNTANAFTAYGSDSAFVSY